MKTKSLLLTILLLSGISSSGATGNVIDSIVGELDHVIDRRDTYFSERIYRIDSLRSELSAIPPSDNRKTTEMLHNIFNEYRSFQSDSARAYSDRELAAARLTGDRKLIVRAQSDRLFSFISGGLFSDAVEVVKETDLNGVDPLTKGQFYFRCIRLYSDMSNYVDGTFSDKNARLSHLYSDSVIALLPESSYESRYASIFKSIPDMLVSEKIEVYSDLLGRNDIDRGEKAMISSILADLHNQRNDTVNATFYKAKSAILDILSAKRETTSSRDLAVFMFQRGDIEHAYRYIRLAHEDAEYFNARHRRAEIGKVMPIIESTRFNALDTKKKGLEKMAVGLSVLSLLLLVSVILIIVQGRRLKASKKLIDDRNAELEATLVELRESTRIKDEYIGYGFFTNSLFIRKIEKLYKLVNRKIAAKQYDDLVMMLKESDLRKEKEEIRSSFDRIFTNIFPTFTAEYRRLFPDDDPTFDEVEPGALTHEMRIFALIRLGISDSESIATFLNYSVNTINTYKSKAKNRSTVPNEIFEQRIMQIRSISSKKDMGGSSDTDDRHYKNYIPKASKNYPPPENQPLT